MGEVVLAHDKKLGRDLAIKVLPQSLTRDDGVAFGRERGMFDGKRIAYLGQNERGVNGIFVQDFVPGADTTSTKREFGGFDSERSTESFGISRDGKQLVVAGWEQLFN